MVSASPVAIVDLLAAILRGDAVAGSVLAAIDPERFCNEAHHHDVLPLVADRLATAPGVPPALHARLQAKAAAEAAGDLLRGRQLRRVVDAMHARGVDPLLMKGAHLAYSHYPRPDLRPRADTDLLVAADGRSIAHDVLLELGYEPMPLMSGELVLYQAGYIWRTGSAALDTIDLHWKIANPQVFAGVLTYEELIARAVPIPRLSAAARGLSDVDALLLASVHRVAHHNDSDLLIWLYDIDLLARRLPPNDWRQVADVATERKVAQVVGRSLARAAAVFGTPVPDLMASLSWGRSPELSAAYLIPRRHVFTMLDEFRALKNWSDRLRLLREHLFPPEQYMRSVFAPASAAPLAVLYARRLVRGTRKLFRGQAQQELR
jgi:putative nucleotidyltransferase-like protein